MWAGVDVGGRRKGFHLALVDGRRLRAGPTRVRSVEAAVRWLQWRAPTGVAVDSPRSAAPDGSRSRPEERELARRICHVRYTPERALLERNRYYEWILRGLELYAALGEAGLDVVECFPTASFTRWAGARGTRTRASWTREALLELQLENMPRSLSQDGRDAIAAALTARSHARGLTESIGEIVVPLESVVD